MLPPATARDRSLRSAESNKEKEREQRREMVCCATHRAPEGNSVFENSGLGHACKMPYLLALQ